MSKTKIIIELIEAEKSEVRVEGEKQDVVILLAATLMASPELALIVENALTVVKHLPQELKRVSKTKIFKNE